MHANNENVISDIIEKKINMFIASKSVFPPSHNIIKITTMIN